MNRVLIDTNIILDIALKREPFFTDSAQIFNMIDEKIIEGYVSATSITDIYYIASRQTDSRQSKNFLFDLIQVIDVVGVGKDIIVDALNSDLKDFEDAVQATAARYNDIEIIVTRNVADFSGGEIEVLEPKDLIKKLTKK